MIDIATRPTQPLTDTPSSSEYSAAIEHLRLALPVIERTSDHMGQVARIIIEEMEEAEEDKQP